MPRSRKRHHSRSRSKTRSRSSSPDRSYEKQKKPGSHEKDGKRRRLEELVDSPHHKRSISEEDQTHHAPVEDEKTPLVDEVQKSAEDTKNIDVNIDNRIKKDLSKVESDELKENKSSDTNGPSNVSRTDGLTDDDIIELSDSDSVKREAIHDKKQRNITPKKPLTPKQLQKKLESEKKKEQRQKEKEEREKERQKIKEEKEAEKQKQLELKQKEKEMKEEQKRKEKEQKRKEREEQEAERRKEKEQERLKRLQDIEEKKQKEDEKKQKEEEKKQKSAALFLNFFKKPKPEEKETKTEVKINSYFMPFEVKSDMRLPPLRRDPLSPNEMKQLDSAIENQDQSISYLMELKCGKICPGKSFKTWPYEDPEEEITVVEADKILGESICEDVTSVHRMKAKFLQFHENRRPAYFGTWRKRTKFIKPRKPFGEDTDSFNYDEDSDDDWEEEEQGESLDVLGDEDEKENENDNDDYEVDNEFFVPHGHLSDDEIDDEENARLSPESLKQKLKLLKDEFEEDMKSKTHKLKPRSIGCVWLNKLGDNVDEAIYRYLEKFAMLVGGPVEIKSRSEAFSPVEKKKVKPLVEIPIEHIPAFLKIIHGNANNQKTVVEQFLTFMSSKGLNIDISKATLTRFLKQYATYKRCEESGPMKNKFGWLVNEDVKDKYNVTLDIVQNTKLDTLGFKIK